MRVNNILNGAKRLRVTGVLCKRQITVPSTENRGQSFGPHLQHLFSSQQDYDAFMEMTRDPSVIDISLDVGKPVTIHWNTHEPCLPMSSAVLTPRDLDTLWTAFSNGHGDRAVIQDTNAAHRLSAFRDFDGTVSGLTLRLAHAAPDVHALSDNFKTYLALGYSTLLFGPPGTGKTTLLRSVGQYLADYVNKRVIMIDDFGELGIPPGNARRMCVHPATTRTDVAMSAIQNHTPNVLVIDELMTADDAASAMSASQRGIQLIATAHGDTLDSIIQNPAFREMMGDVQHAAVSDAEMTNRGSKFVRARRNEPTFRGAFDVQRGKLYPNLSASIDALHRTK